MKKRLKGTNVEIESPLKFLRELYNVTALERKPLQFTYTRLNSLLRTLEITSLEDFTSLSEVSNFMTLVSTYLDGFAIVIEPHVIIILCCILYILFIIYICYCY